MKMLDSIDKNEYVTIFGSGKESFDFVSVKECKPFSKTKTWILEESDSGGGDS